VSDSLFSHRPGRTPGRTAEIKAWAAESLGLGDDVAVMVTELHCTEPGCPPLETVVAVLGANGPVRQYKVRKPLADVTREDIRAISAQAGPPDCHEPHAGPAPEYP
jgi:hypothetical protein